jgi:SAM-dependent methyltransferase
MRPGPGELPAESYGRGPFDRFHGVSRLPDGRFKSVLGLGSAQGSDFLAIIDRIDDLMIAEPSQRLRSHRIGGLQPRYVDPSLDTALPFFDASFALVFCRRVPYRIPKVSAQLRELARVLSPGGHVLGHEPIVSLGDWTGPRKVELTELLGFSRSLISFEGRDITRTCGSPA